MYIKGFLCDGLSPTDEEIEECIKVVENENCAIVLYWIAINSQMYNIFIRKGITFEECKEQIPKYYGM